MRSLSLLFVCSFVTTLLTAQNLLHKVAIDDDNGVFEYQDSKNNVVFSADTFMAMPAQKMKDVAAFVLMDGRSFYQFRNGKQQPGVYFWDNWYDCENDGFIRFRDTTKLVGQYNSRGEIAVPARYNELNKLTNGYCFGLKGSTKACPDLECEHYSWEGGEMVFLDSNGTEIALFDNNLFFWDLDLYGLSISNTPSKDSSCLRFSGADGKFYSIPYATQQFIAWYQKTGVKNLEKNALKQLNYYHGENNGTLSKKRWWKKYRSAVNAFYANTRNNPSVVVSNELISDLSPGYAPFTNNCGELHPKHLVFEVLATDLKKGLDILRFVKVGNTYCLIELEDE